jgi:hypothetical protein
MTTGRWHPHALASLPQVLEETGLTLLNTRFERVENCIHTKDGAIVAHYVTIFMRGEVDGVRLALPMATFEMMMTCHIMHLHNYTDDQTRVSANRTERAATKSGAR